MTIIVLYNFRYKKLSKPRTQLLRYKQLVSYLPVNASMDNTIIKSGVFPMPAFTKSTLFQTLETFFFKSEFNCKHTKKNIWNKLLIFLIYLAVYCFY